MTNPLHDLTDAHLQAASVAMETLPQPRAADIRHHPQNWPTTILLARHIAANEKLAAELAELRAKYEPEPVDPVEAEVLRASLGREFQSHHGKIAWLNGYREGLRRGMEMQPDRFTQEEAERIAVRFLQCGGTYLSMITRALTTPHAELRAMLGDG